MKRLFFLLVLSVMINGCHDDNRTSEIIACQDVKQTPKTKDLNNVEQPTNDCSNSPAINNSHPLNNIEVKGCPVK